MSEPTDSPLSPEADNARMAELLLLQRAQFDATGIAELNKIYGQLQHQPEQESK